MLLSDILHNDLAFCIHYKMITLVSLLTVCPHPKLLQYYCPYSFCYILHLCMNSKSLQSCLPLCDPMDFGLPGSSVLGFSRQGYWRGLLCPHHFTASVQYSFSSVTQSCLTLCDPMNHSMPGLPVHHHLPESTQPMSIESVLPSNHLIPSPPAFNLFQHQGLFK